MKHLQDYISESIIKENTTPEVLTFNFKDLENGEETIKSLEGQEGVSIDDLKLTLSINSDNASKFGTVQDILQQFAESIRNSSKRTNDEQYAQKTKKFADTVAKMNDLIDSFKADEEEEKEKQKEEESE